MARIKQGILGGFSGKVAGIVGSSWKGIAVMKALPLSVANPKTAGQVAQRSKFSNVVAFAGAILASVIKPLWDRFASGQSGYNEFISTNINLFVDVSPDPAGSLVISKGKMAATPISSNSVEDGGPDVVMNWADDSGEGFKLESDVPFVVVVNETKEEVEGFETAGVRSDTTVTVSLSHNPDAGDTVHTYLAFKRADGTIVSNTAYLIGVPA